MTPGNRADVVHYPASNLDDLVMDDEAAAIEELALYREAGGGAIVDATTLGLHRDPEALLRISVATDVHVTMGTGVYVTVCHPPEIERLSEDGAGRPDGPRHRGGRRRDRHSSRSDRGDRLRGSDRRRS